MNKRTLVASLIAAGLIGSSVGYSAATLPLLRSGPAPVTLASTHVTTTHAGRPLVNAATLPDFSALVEKYGKAVVNITVTELAQGSDAPGSLQLDPDDPLYQFFQRFQFQSPRRMPVQGIGSGFIVRADGVILTNAHVVDGAREVDVKLTDRREFKAKVLGVDELSDIAVVKIAAKNLPVVKLGDPAKLKVGDWVAAIGSPFGFENTITQGIVSAKSRSLADETYVPFIQTDVAVNPGNSGGPLFDLHGEVVGINSQIYSTSGGYEGLSFAIPIDIASNVERQILQHGKVTRARLGITVQEVTQGIAEAFALSGPNGALISSVAPDSPASRAGLEPGDVIIKLNGSPVVDAIQLPVQIARMKPGSVIKLEVLRKGKAKSIEVALGELKSEKIAAAATAQSHPRLGVTVRALTPAERNETGELYGVLVESSSGPAERAGIEPGDVILAVNGQAVSNAEQLRVLVRHAGHRLALLIERNDVRRYVPVDLG